MRDGRLHRLIGIRFRLPGDNPGVDMMIKGSATGGSDCWTATAVVAPYHVGIRHYTVTSNGEFAAYKTAAEKHNADLAVCSLTDATAQAHAKTHSFAAAVGRLRVDLPPERSLTTAGRRRSIVSTPARSSTTATQPAVAHAQLLSPTGGDAQAEPLADA